MLLSYYQEEFVEAGCDEAGRGCLAGPVYAAAVILPKNFRNRLLNDSKQLTEKERDKLRPIIEKKALAWAIGIATHEEIDVINILNASFLAMHRAVAKLLMLPQLLLIDGNRFNPYQSIPHKCIVEGDAKYASIAAASVLAKTYRDAYMKQMHELYPQYHWNKNKGYATLLHRKQITEHGFCDLHRKSFRLLPDQLELDFDGEKGLV
jgi:ribonuclease HII